MRDRMKHQHLDYYGDDDEQSGSDTTTTDDAHLQQGLIRRFASGRKRCSYAECFRHARSGGDLCFKVCFFHIFKIIVIDC